MYLSTQSHTAFQHGLLGRLAEWWPAALIGLVALLGALPEGNAQTLPGL